MKLIMARSAIWVRQISLTPQKAHLLDVCVQYEINPPMGFQDLLGKQNVASNQAYYS